MSPFVHREEPELLVSRAVSSDIHQYRGVDVSITADSKLGIDSPEFGARISRLGDVNTQAQKLTIDGMMATEVTTTVFQRKNLSNLDEHAPQQSTLEMEKSLLRKTDNSFSIISHQDPTPAHNLKNMSSTYFQGKMRLVSPVTLSENGDNILP